MSLCPEEMALLKEAGKNLSFEILKPPFKMLYSRHATGFQATINVMEPKTKTNQIVWCGSVWDGPSYEFNDTGKVAGIQPGFEYCAPIIAMYFRDLAHAVAEREAQKERDRQAAEERVAQQKKEIADATRALIAESFPGMVAP